MTESTLEEIEEIHAKATPGPWFAESGDPTDGLTWIDDGRKGDGALFRFKCEAHDAQAIVSAMNNIIPMVRRVRDAELEASRLNAALDLKIKMVYAANSENTRLAEQFTAGEQDWWEKEKEVTRLREAFGFDTPWPVREVLKRLVEGSEHLLHGHDCDCHGYETLIQAIESARKIQAVLTPRPDQLTGNYPPETQADVGVFLVGSDTESERNKKLMAIIFMIEKLAEGYSMETNKDWTTLEECCKKVLYYTERAKSSEPTNGE